MGMRIRAVLGNSSWYLAKILHLVLLWSKQKTEAISLRVEDEEELEELGPAVVFGFGRAF